MTTLTAVTIEADPEVPIIRIARDFAATREQLFGAHTDPELLAQWVGPNATRTRIEHWDARTGGSWRYAAAHDGMETGASEGYAKLDAMLADGAL